MTAFMVGAVFITLIVCVTILVWKYFEECDFDISYIRYATLKDELIEIKEMLKGKE